MGDKDEFLVASTRHGDMLGTLATTLCELSESGLSLRQRGKERDRPITRPPEMERKRKNAFHAPLRL